MWGKPSQRKTGGGFWGAIRPKSLRQMICLTAGKKARRWQLDLPAAGVGIFETRTMGVQGS
jgi:hypothetical protein